MKKIEKFNKELCNIKYGWYDKDGRLHESLKEGNFVKNYRMQDCEEIKWHKSAICWELCEMEREFFKKEDYPFITVFAMALKNKRKPCHTFLVFKDKDKYCWFEASWKRMKGIKKYDSLEELFDVIRENFYDFTGSKENYKLEDVNFYKYNKPRSGCSCNGFYYNALLFGKKIKNSARIL